MGNLTGYLPQFYAFHFEVPCCEEKFVVFEQQLFTLKIRSLPTFNIIPKWLHVMRSSFECISFQSLQTWNASFSIRIIAVRKVPCEIESIQRDKLNFMFWKLFLRFFALRDGISRQFNIKLSISVY